MYDSGEVTDTAADHNISATGTLSMGGGKYHQLHPKKTAMGAMRSYA
jgi:hypothetical protein